MPGVPDDFATLAFNVLHATAAQQQQAASASLGSLGRGGNMSWGRPLTEWLGMRGVSRLFEGTEAANAAAGAKGERLEEQAWWPFSASLGCSRFLGEADLDAHRSYIASLDTGASVAAATDAWKGQNKEEQTQMRAQGRAGAGRKRPMSERLG